ncbi:PREDICTED: zinc finger SWIM domain-containing protein 3 [Gekko japonicus]|uniref:Zinc finger SWIM domain-containing protein 3 n=1 Tax=Gekko japonicus TaxID=146911 RepID=A0ABM1K273_GEKJA|nr:PREDICTED: zinc finger SWIM domain-containing protein 3 [Gekko japonicus]
MEVGSCFKNYEDFKECFQTYKKENRLQYGLKNCVSVRFYNRKNGTNIREDVVFMQVKFGCGRSREYSKKRKQHPQLCPAYLVLQYNEELDRLVISELNSNHVHAESKTSLTSCDPPPVTRMTAQKSGCKAQGSPPAKLRRQQPAEVEGSSQSNGLSAKVPTESHARVKVEVDSDSHATVKVEMDSEESLPPSPHEGSEIPEAEKESPPNSALFRVGEVMKNFLRVDMGSLASISAGSDQALERLNFQTSKMKSLFVKFPESLLLHQVQRERGHLLYAFLVESKDRVGKLVHFAILREDTAENARKMFSVFKEFNPEWQKIKVVFVDVSFLHRPVLQELFPSAQVLLSVYHTVRLLEKKLKESRASFSVKQNLRLALREAVFSTSNTNLETLSQQVKRLIDRELYSYLQANWFSCEMLWYMHAKKGLHSCSTYIDSLDLITQKLANLFSTRFSLEINILRFVEYADCFNTKGLEHLNQGSASVGEDGRSGLMEELKTTQTRASVRRGSSTASQQSPVARPLKQLTRFSPAKPVSTMLVALRETCTDLAYQLCLNEWDVVQKSTQLMTSTKSKTKVQLLEETHQVSRDCRRCTCYFHCRYQLPCRHILSVLHANRQVVEEGMVCKRWQKKYQHLSTWGENLPECPAPSRGTPGALSEERRDKILSLSKELGNLLLQSEGEELEERTSTLKMIVDIWAKSCELREEEEEEAEGKYLSAQNMEDLPFLWVKKEEMEVEVAEATPRASAEDGQTFQLPPQAV